MLKYFIAEQCEIVAKYTQKYLEKFIFIFSSLLSFLFPKKKHVCVMLSLGKILSIKHQGFESIKMFFSLLLPFREFHFIRGRFRREVTATDSMNGNELRKEALGMKLLISLVSISHSMYIEEKSI